MSDAILIPVIIVGFLIIFPLFWCGIVGLIAYIGGWQKLASDYPAQPSDTAEWKHMTTGWLGGATFSLGQYKSVLSVGKDGRYIHLKPMILFSMFHPQISIPRIDISREGHGDSLFSTARLNFANSQVVLRMSGKLANWLLG